MDWHSSQRRDRFRYVRVNPATMRDTTELENVIDGGSVSRNSLTAIKSSADIEYHGKLDIGNDYLRIYSISEVGGETETVLHGTYIISTPETRYTGSSITGKAQLYSLLLIMNRIRTTEPLVIPKGTNAVDFAASLVSGVGLNAVVTRSDEAICRKDRNYDIGVPYLEVANDLLDYSDYYSMGIDGSGTVIIKPYRSMDEQTPSVYFIAGENSTFSPNITHELDDFSVPNRLTVVCSTPDSEPLFATAVNNDPANRFSIVSRGGVIIDAEPEYVDDISSQEALEKMAEFKLHIKTVAVESQAVTHVYEPYEITDCCFLKLDDMEFKGTIVSAETKLAPGMITDMRFRRFVRF